MGCVHGKCCGDYQLASSDEENQDNRDSNPHAIAFDNHRHILTESVVGSVPVPSHKFRLQYSFLTQRGYYPDSPGKENQDSFCIRTQLQGNPNLHFFGVFDGHGQFGAQCSNFVSDKLLDILSSDASLLDDPVQAYQSAFLATNAALHESEIDDSMSGTTAITVLVSGDTLFVANVGDSRAVIGVRGENSVLAEDLSRDQTPFRMDECERVKRSGARVLSVDQLEGVKDPDIQSWGDEENDEGDPPRLWVQNGMYPGTAFTRSVGDATAETIGVIAVPEVSIVRLKPPDHLFFVVASDGVFEFLSSQAVVDMVNKFTDPRDACAAVAAESYKLWLEHENRTDDITIIIVHINDLDNSGAGATDRTSGVDAKATLLVAEKRRADKLIYVGPQDHLLSESFSEVQPSLHNFPMERNPVSVAPSQQHIPSLWKCDHT